MVPHVSGPRRQYWCSSIDDPPRKQAYAIQRIAQTRMPQAQVKLFEVTTLNGGSLAPIARGYAASTHIPDARIMLIPKAGA